MIISPFRAIIPLGHRGGAINWATRKPSGLVLTTLSPTSIRAAWTNAGTGFDGHSVEISSDGVAFTEVDTVLFGTNTLDITGLTSGTLYYVRVRAYKGVEHSPYCDVVSEETVYYPNEIANLWGWYDAEQLTGYSDNGAVAPLTDFGGSARHLAQATAELRGIYKTNILNGKPSVRTDGSDDYWQLYGTFPSQPFTTFLVVKRLAGVDYRSALGTGGSTGIIAFASDTEMRIGNGTALAKTGLASLLNRAVIVSAVNNGANSVLAVNGGEPSSGNSGISNGDRVCVGDAASSGSTKINADYFDVVVYTGAFDATARRRVEKYLSWKYAIELEPI